MSGPEGHTNDDGAKASLLLHACCGPCSTAVVERLARRFSLTVLYYNPNIWPQSEHDARWQELRRLGVDWNFDVLLDQGGKEEWEESTKEFADQAEGGNRCLECFRLRLERAVETAEELGIEWIATTLTISPHKRSQDIFRIGREVTRDRGVRLLEEDFKKRDGFKRSVELSREHGMRRQDYCGCRHSLRERDERNAAGGAQR